MQRYHHTPQAYIATIIGTVFFVGAIIFLIVGGVDLQRKYPQVKYYANSMCRVNSRDYKTYKCPTKYVTYTCYGPIWGAYYGLNETIFAEVEIETRYSTVHEALKKTKEYEIGKSYSCWYDTRHPTQAQWDQPSILLQIILLSCGGASILLCILFFYITYLIVKNEKLNN